MRKYRCKETVDAVKYLPGMEDGKRCNKYDMQECSFVVADGCPDHTECQEKKFAVPYIECGCINKSISENDYIVNYNNYEVDVIPKKDFESKYELVDNKQKGAVRNEEAQARQRVLRQRTTSG